MSNNLADVSDHLPTLRCPAYNSEEALASGRPLAEVYAVAAMIAQSRPPECEAAPESFLPTIEVPNPDAVVPVFVVAA